MDLCRLLPGLLWRGSPGERRSVQRGWTEGSPSSSQTSGLTLTAPLCLHVRGPTCAPSSGGSVQERWLSSAGC